MSTTPIPVATAHDGPYLKLIKWVLDANETGDAIVVAAYSDKTVQWQGTGGAGITIQGSNDPAGSAFATLNDPQGNPLSAVTSDKIENILEHCYLLRPVAGAGVSQATVWLLLASTR